MAAFTYSSLAKFLRDAQRHLLPGPVALIFVEDRVEVGSTLRHNRRLGFATQIVFAPPKLDLDCALGPTVIRVASDPNVPNHREAIVNAVIARASGVWFYMCYNAEYLFFPFCETRSIVDMLAFHGQEHRSAMLCYAIDLYATDLCAHPSAVALDTALIDGTGYYAQMRSDPVTRRPKDRQLDFFGGLGWRYEEGIAPIQRNIDRIALFRAQPGLKLRPDNTFNVEEYNTYTGPWHHNMTASIATFRKAKALRQNLGLMAKTQSFRWCHSVGFKWHSQQLLDLGLMEPGQWF